ncbi:MAG: hypothetical protein ACXQTS_01655 [Candidatus Methanospirareceae archaeon]
MEDAKKLNPDLNPELFLPSPKDVLEAIKREGIVKEWLEFIAKEHEAPKKKLLLFTPCAEKKPYEPPRSPLYKKLLELEKSLSSVYMCAVSEPLALEPREYWGFRWGERNLIYDAPFFPWIEEYGYEWDESVAKEVWGRLAVVAREWFERNGYKFERVVAFACPNSGYRKILKFVDVDIYVPEVCPDAEVSYEENVSRVYTQPKVWEELEEVVRGI